MKLLNPLMRLVLMACGAMMMASGCVIAQPHEGYYDRDHHRYYHEHAWVACSERDERCH